MPQSVPQAPPSSPRLYYPDRSLVPACRACLKSRGVVFKEIDVTATRRPRTISCGAARPDDTTPASAPSRNGRTEKGTRAP